MEARIAAITEVTKTLDSPFSQRLEKTIIKKLKCVRVIGYFVFLVCCGSFQVDSSVTVI